MDVDLNERYVVKIRSEDLFSVYSGRSVLVDATFDSGKFDVRLSCPDFDTVPNDFDEGVFVDVPKEEVLRIDAPFVVNFYYPSCDDLPSFLGKIYDAGKFEGLSIPGNKGLVDLLLMD